MNFQARFFGDGSDWLKQFKQRLSKKSKRQVRVRRTGATALEALEQRTLLSATGALVGNQLRIVTDANESVSVSQDLLNPAFAAVLVNGSPISSLPTIPLASILSLDIRTGELDNTVDLTGVTVAFSNLSSIRIQSGDGHDTILLSPAFPSSVFAGDGHDTIFSSDAADTINGENGNDSIVGGLGDDSIDAGDGNDSVTGDEGNDFVQAGDGDDTVNGGDGNDTIMGDDGTDMLSGDAGSDSIIGDLGDDVIRGGDDDDMLIGGGGNDNIDGENGVDTLNGSSGADVLRGSAGNDVLLGMAGHDTVFGGDDNDFIKGGDGRDMLAGNTHDDTILGGTGNDMIYGDSDDSLSGEMGDDQLFGEDGRDTLIGSRGSDLLDGGNGNDILRSAPIFGNAPAMLPPPPAPPVIPPGPPTTNVAGILNNANDSGMGMIIGGTNTMAIGTGDGSLVVTVDALGSFGLISPTFSGATFDPLGAITAAATTFDSSVYFRVGNMGPRVRLDAIAAAVSPIRATPTESNSTFTIGTLLFTVTQLVEAINGPMGVQTGALLTQTYRITNLNPMGNANYELVRYYDGDLTYAFGGGDGAGFLVANSGEDVVFLTDQAGPAGFPTTFVGITAEGGQGAPPVGRFQVDAFNGLETAVQAGTALTNVVTNDIDLDLFVDTGLDYDTTVAFQNNFQANPFQTRTYTTHTIFGSGSPAVAATNISPVAVDDSVLLPTGPLGGTITIDVTANDFDADGAIDVSTVTIVTPPSNGTAISLGNGLVQYTSNPGFSGMDFFRYSITDNQGSTSTALVQIAVLDIDSNPDTFVGGAGNDTIVGEEGNDVIDGGNGADIINGGGGDDLIYGGGGNDSILGGDGRDTLVGNGGTDTLNGGDSDDTILWRGQKDFKVTVESSGGQDFLVLQGDNTANNITIQTVGKNLVATEGTAQITIDAMIQDITVNLAGGDDRLTMLDMSAANLITVAINGERGNDTIDLSKATRVGTLLIRADGGDGNDKLIGSEFSESLLGGAGDDVINAAAGDDQIEGGDGNDLLNGGVGNDSITAGAGNDELNGGVGNDSLVGESGNDTVNGESGDDTLQGNFGDDVLNGSTGNDSISGGLGRDALIGAAGNDTLDGGHNDDTILGHSGSDLILASNGNDFARGGDGNDTINGGDGDDTLFGENGDDLIGGFDGHDFMTGDAGSDTLLGGDGNDTILGGSEDDVVLGEEGDDAVNGGGGFDLGAQGDGNDVPLMRVEKQDEDFVLSAALLAALNGQL